MLKTIIFIALRSITKSDMKGLTFSKTKLRIPCAVLWNQKSSQDSAWSVMLHKWENWITLPNYGFIVCEEMTFNVEIIKVKCCSLQGITKLKGSKRQNTKKTSLGRLVQRIENYNFSNFRWLLFLLEGQKIYKADSNEFKLISMTTNDWVFYSHDMIFH